ncbi:MAG: PQQ-binding-like beta-propeller repeat protein [Mariniblastus sp.]
MSHLKFYGKQDCPVFDRISFGRRTLLALSIAITLVTSTVTVAQEAKRSTPEKKHIADSTHWSSFCNGGNSHVSKNAALPSSWSQKEGISWDVELPGYGQSAPLVIGDKILLTAVKGPEKETNLVVCVSRKTGAEVWRTSQPSSLKGPSNFMYSRAAPTPVADYDQVIAFFESGDLLAVGISDGKKRWERDLKVETGGLKSRHGLGSSLTQTDDLFFINLEHDGPSALIAIQKSDGQTRWKTERPSGSSWSSPVVMRRGDEYQVVVSSAGEAAGYDSETGKEIWKVSDLVGNSVPSPLVVGDRIFLGARKPEFGSVDAAAKSNLCLEFQEGEVSPKVAWRSERCIADYCSPVVCGEFLFLINGSGILGCLDKNTGEEKYRQRLGFECWATPIVRGNQLFVFGKNGKSLVIEAGGEFKKIGENNLWDSTNPPRPVSYVEYFPANANGSGHGAGHGHGAKHGGAKDETAEHGGHGSDQHPGGESAGNSHGGGHGDSHGSGKKPGEAMLAGMLKADKDGDEALTGDEIPKRLVAVMENIDLNKDGSLDKGELEKMAKSFAAKRAGSKASSRDPIVYGVAADSKGILVRTGTRLYAIGGDSP